MRSLTVEARNLESARRLYIALLQFGPKITGNADEGYSLKVELDTIDGSRGIAVLDALEQYVDDRHDGPARIDVNGRKYVLKSV